jgi:3-keto-disaccharide hydrolase
MSIICHLVHGIRTPWPRPLRCAVGAILSLVLLVATVAAGPDDKDEAPPAGASGTKVLFDGKSLEGWKKCDFYKAGEVKVEDGMIIMSRGVSMSGITSTCQDLPTTNYELRYEAMRLAGRDFFAAATFPIGKSYITLVNGGWGGGVTGLSSLDGMDASENETTRSIRYQDKTWYCFRVRVTDKMIRCLTMTRRSSPSLTATAGLPPASRPAGTSRWASPPGKAPARCVRSRSGRSRRQKSPRPYPWGFCETSYFYCNRYLC